jgi:hypothetical protein
VNQLITSQVMNLLNQPMETLTLYFLWVPFHHMTTGSHLLVMTGMIGMKRQKQSMLLMPTGSNPLHSKHIKYSFSLPSLFSYLVHQPLQLE